MLLLIFGEQGLMCVHEEARMGEIEFGFRRGGRDPRRIEVVLESLREVWIKSPDLRLGQIVIIAAGQHARHGDVFSVEDDLVLEGLRRLLGESWVAPGNRDQDPEPHVG